MLVLRFSTHVKNIMEHTNVMCSHFSMQEEDFIEHTNAMCHLCTLLVNL